MTTANDGGGESGGIGRRPGVWAWALLTPLLAWLTLFVVLPTVIMVVFSLSGRDDIGTVVYQFTTENYKRIAGGGQAVPLLLSGVAGAFAAAATFAVRRKFRHLFFGPLTAFLIVFWTTLNVVVLRTPADVDAARWLKIAVVSVNYAAAATAICVVLGYPAAYFIGRTSPGWRNVLLLAVMIPFWTSFLIRTYAWVTIFRNVQNTFADQLQWLNAHLAWLGSFNPVPTTLYPSMTGVMIGLVYTYLPFMILPIYTSVERLDNALIDAAMDLGATPARAFRGVILPLTRPGIVAGIVLVFVPAVGMFAINDILGGRQEMLIGNVIERQFTAARDKPFGAAMGMILLVLFIATYALSLRRRATNEAA